MDTLNGETPVSEERRVALEQLRLGAKTEEVARTLVNMGMTGGDALRLAEKLDVRFVHPRERRFPPVVVLLRAVLLSVAACAAYGAIAGSIVWLAALVLEHQLELLKVVFVALIPMGFVGAQSLFFATRGSHNVPVPVLRNPILFYVAVILAVATGMLIGVYAIVALTNHPFLVENYWSVYGTAFRPLSRPMLEMFIATAGSDWGVAYVSLTFAASAFGWRRIYDTSRLA